MRVGRVGFKDYVGARPEVTYDSEARRVRNGTIPEAAHRWNCAASSQNKRSDVEVELIHQFCQHKCTMDGAPTLHENSEHTSLAEFP